MVLAIKPGRASDLHGYSSLIVHAARKFKGGYDINFRKRAAAFPSEQWAEINPTLRQLAFANASPRTHCTPCFSLDHTTQLCDDYESGISNTTAKDEKGKEAASQPGSSSGECPAGDQPICGIRPSLGNMQVLAHPTRSTSPKTARLPGAMPPTDGTGAQKTRASGPFAASPLGVTIHITQLHAHTTLAVSPLNYASPTM